MPSFRNIAVNPKAHVLEDAPVAGEGGRRAVVAVEGLVCNIICVRRVLTSLETQPYVASVTHEPASDAFVITYRGPTARGEELAAAALAPVVAPGLRAFVEGLWTRLRRAPETQAGKP